MKQSHKVSNLATMLCSPLISPALKIPQNEESEKANKKERKGNNGSSGKEDLGLLGRSQLLTFLCLIIY